MKQVLPSDQFQAIKRKIVFITGIDGNFERLLITALQPGAGTHMSPAHRRDFLPDDFFNTVQFAHFIS